MRFDHRWLIALAFALAACQAAPSQPRSTEKDPGVLAAEALEKGDYAKAADLYASALAAEPESLPLHYGLGVAASYLARRADAIREFLWVLERGEADTTEVKRARAWLASVGALPRRESSSPPPEEAREPEQPEQKPTHASLQGRAVSAESGGPDTPLQRMVLFLYDYPKRMVYFRVRTDEEGRFRFANVPPGIYKLTDRASGPPRWRLRIELKPAQESTLELNSGNSTKVRDDFPDLSQEVVPTQS
jgi:tetratricopeptide (TPR) repeat protein